jgi:Cdc6-like AAA superfamily ATPase
MEGINPYRPGAGIKPLVLAGRDNEIKRSNNSLDQVIGGSPQRPIAFYGLRGVGKTVLLNEIQEHATEKKIIFEHIEISENDNFKNVIMQKMRKILHQIDMLANARGKLLTAFKVLKALSVTFPDGPEVKLDVDAIVGVADSGAFQNDLTDLFEAIGDVAKEKAKVICFFIDEMQYLKVDDFEAIIASSHRISQRGFPIQFICAGLPQILAKAADAKSYAERQFEFIPLDRLKAPFDTEAIVGPLVGKGISIEPDAIKAIVKVTGGYPYFIQEFGKILFESAQEPNFTIGLVNTTEKKFFEQLDESFYKSRWDRATDTEKKYMRAMAKQGKGPYKSTDVADNLNRKQESVGPLRAGLIHKGFVFSPAHSLIDFTVPGFEDFLKRVGEV